MTLEPQGLSACDSKADDFNFVSIESPVCLYLRNELFFVHSTLGRSTDSEFVWQNKNQRHCLCDISSISKWRKNSTSLRPLGTEGYVDFGLALSPARNLGIDGANIVNSANISVGPHSPSWDAPQVGSPTGHRVYVRGVKESGADDGLLSSFVLPASLRSLKIPGELFTFDSNYFIGVEAEVNVPDPQRGLNYTFRSTSADSILTWKDGLRAR